MNIRISTLCVIGVLAYGMASGVEAAPSILVGHGPTPVMYSDAQLERYVDAARSVAAIAAQYSGRISKAKNETDRRQRQQQADSAMIAAVRQHGLSLEEYNGINQAIQNDQALLQRVRILAGSRPAREGNGYIITATNAR